jgi:hypothetical protein
LKLQALLILFFCVLLGSCSFVGGEEEQAPVARVNDHYLYPSDIEDHFENLPDPKDSLMIVSRFINTWATERLLLDGAKRNLSKNDQDNFDQLVRDYKNELYTNNYKEALITKSLDTLVSDQEAQEFYEANKQNFNLNEGLLKLRYIQIANDYNNKKHLQEFFIRFNDQDRYILDSLKFQFKKYFLNDSIWVKKSVVINSVNPVNPTNADNLLKKTNFIQLRDSLGLYLISVRETLSRKQTAPLEYVRPTINQIIKNKRKLALVKQLEKEIKDDAIKNNKFEIYN